MIFRADRIWRPYTQHALAAPPIKIERARGAYLHAEGGRKIFDAISSWWVTTHGHGHPRIAAAISRQAKALEQVIFTSFTHEPAENLAKGLIAIAPPGLSSVFYSDDGSTAVEAALKIALSYWQRTGRKRDTIVALEHGYHGDTFGAMSVSGRSSFTSDYEPFLFKVERIPCPEPGTERKAFDSFERLLRSKRGKIAALIVEPLVLGAGGMKMYSSNALKVLGEMCARHRVLLIADEVMTGFGRTGTMFACAQAGITPDILCLSKGITGGFLPLGATLVRPEIFEAFRSENRSKTFFHGHSYTANPIACAAAAANLEIFKKEPVFERIGKIETLHQKRLAGLAGRPQVKSVRSTGVIAAIELNAGDAGYLSRRGPQLAKFFLSRGVLLRPLGNVVYLLPPYCSTEKDLNRAYDLIEESLLLKPS